MAYVNVNGLWLPALHHTQGGAGVASTLSTVDATGELAVWLGRMWNPTRSTKSVRKVHFLPATVVSAGGSVMTISLQNVDAVNGPGYRPDGTPDQTVAAALNTMASNTYFTSGNFDADRSVNFGELLAVVIEFDSGGRLGADSLIVSNMSHSNSGQHSGVATFVASAWGVPSAVNNLLLEMSDGTFGLLTPGWVYSSSASGAVSESGTPDEAALEFQLPINCKLDGVYIPGYRNVSSTNVDLVLYDAADGVVNSLSHDGNISHSTASNRPWETPFPESEILADTTYRMSIKPTTAGGGSHQYQFTDVAAAAHLDVLPGGQKWKLATRTNGGAWTTTATRRPAIGLRLSAIDIPVGGGSSASFGIIG